MAPPAAAAASSLVRRAAAAASRRLFLARAFASGGGDKAKRVLMPVASGTEPIEAAATADILNRAGARVTVATADPPRDDGLVVEAAYGVKFVADSRVADLEGETFDLIALPVRVPSPLHSLLWGLLVYSN
jgi:protein deglycase